MIQTFGFIKNNLNPFFKILKRIFSVSKAALFWKKKISESDIFKKSVFLKKIILKIFLILFLLHGSFIQAEVFEDTVLARAFASGYAVAAQSGNLEAGFKNPALLVGSSETFISASSYFEGMYYTSLIAKSMSVLKGNWAIYLPFRIVNDIPKQNLI